jgi:HK97 family phage portal protein
MPLLEKVLSRTVKLDVKGVAQPGGFPNTRNLGGWMGNQYRKFDWKWFSPNSKIDYTEKVGDLMSNSAVAACVNWICKNFTEAPPILHHIEKDGSYTPLPDHPLTKLLRKPNPFYSSKDLWSSTLTSYLTEGNGYWLKTFNRLGSEVVELRYMPHKLIEPNWDPYDRNSYIDNYEYKTGNPDDKVEYIPFNEMVHFKNLHDTNNTRKGFAPLRSAIREIFTDNEATNFAAQMLENYGVPSMILAPKADDVILKPGAGDTIRKEFAERVSGDKRGSIMVLSAGMQAEKIGFNPKEMELSQLHKTPEERIAATLNLPAVVVGLGAGQGKGFGTVGNMKEARDGAFENCLVPLQLAMAATIELQLLPDFEEHPEEFCLIFDLNKVRALQADQDQLSQRIATLVRDNIMKVSEARIALSLPKEEGDERYMYEIMAENQMNLADHTSQLSIDEMANQLSAQGAIGTGNQTNNSTNNNRQTQRQQNSRTNSTYRDSSAGGRNISAPGNNGQRKKDAEGQDGKDDEFEPSSEEI